MILMWAMAATLLITRVREENGERTHWSKRASQLDEHFQGSQQGIRLHVYSTTIVRYWWALHGSNIHMIFESDLNLMQYCRHKRSDSYMNRISRNEIKWQRWRQRKQTGHSQDLLQQAFPTKLYFIGGAAPKTNVSNGLEEFCRSHISLTPRFILQRINWIYT